MGKGGPITTKLKVPGGREGGFSFAIATVGGVHGSTVQYKKKIQKRTEGSVFITSVPAGGPRLPLQNKGSPCL